MNVLQYVCFYLSSRKSNYKELTLRKVSQMFSPVSQDFMVVSRIQSFAHGTLSKGISWSPWLWLCLLQRWKQCHPRTFAKNFTSDHHYHWVLEMQTQFLNLVKVSLELKYFLLFKVYSNYETNELLILKYSSNYKIVLATQCIQRLNLEKDKPHSKP